MKKLQLAKLLEPFSKGAVIPCLESVLVTKKELTATNLDTTIIIRRDTHIDKPTCIPIKRFNDLLKDYEDVTIATHDEYVDILGDTDKIKLSVFNPEEFPKVPELTNEDLLGVITPETLSKITIAKEFCGNDEHRQNLMHVYVKDKVVATDGHAMYFESCDNLKKEILISHLLIKLMNILKDENWVVHDFGNHYQLACHEVTIIHRKLDETYPQYSAVIPEAKDVVAEVIPSSFIDFEKAINKCLKYGNKIINMVTLEIGNNEIQLSASDIEFETEIKVRLNATVKGKMIIGFNGKKLLQTVVGKEIKLRFIAENKAILINNNSLCMPVMLRQY